MSDPLDQVRFWAQVMGDAKRTVACNPELESRVKGWVDSHGLAGTITVIADSAVPEDRLYVMDTPALEAGLREVMQRPIRFLE